MLQYLIKIFSPQLYWDVITYYTAYVSLNDKRFLSYNNKHNSCGPVFSVLGRITQFLKPNESLGSSFQKGKKQKAKSRAITRMLQTRSEDLQGSLTPSTDSWQNHCSWPGTYLNQIFQGLDFHSNLWLKLLFTPRLSWDCILQASNSI